MRINKDCHVNAKFIEINNEDLLDNLINYYKDTNELAYLKLRKEQLNGKTKNFERIMENGGNANIQSIIDQLIEKANLIQLDVQFIDENILIIMDDEFDDDEFDYNEELDLYVNISSKIFVSPDNWGAKKISWFSYIKIIEIL